MEKSTDSSALGQVKLRWQPHAMVAAWLLPGLGHVVLGQYRRGLVIGGAIGGLWLAGLLIGGISVIDHMDRADGQQGRFSLWFIGQALTGPTVAADQYHQYLKRVSFARFEHEPQPEDKPEPVYSPSFGRVWEQGVLYTALAGMLNLLAMVDAGYCDAQSRREGAKVESDADEGRST